MQLESTRILWVPTGISGTYTPSVFVPRLAGSEAIENIMICSKNFSFLSHIKYAGYSDVKAAALESNLTISILYIKSFEVR